MFSSAQSHKPYLHKALVIFLVALLALVTAHAFAQSGSPAGGDPPGDPPPATPDAAQTPGDDDGAGDDGDMFTAPPPPAQPDAAISTQITYQGVLQDGNNPANGSFDMRFRLFDDPAAGAQVAEVTANNVAVEDGQFTTLLDFGADAAAFARQALWLEIAVQGPGDPGFETLTPRQAVTAAPLAHALPNVSTDPDTGYVAIGDGARLNGFQHLGINAEVDSWVGMYITGGGPNSRPYYGYATDDEGSYQHAWTEFHGASGQWRLYVQGSLGLAVDGNGNAIQPPTADGLVKAAATVECWPDAAFVTVYNSFNLITGAPVTIAPGLDLGECYVNFGFNLTDRFFSATAIQIGEHRGVTCAVDTGNNNRLHCTRWRSVDAGSQGWGGRIMIVVY